MRRLLLATLFALLSVCSVGQLAAAPAHAQIYNPIVVISPATVATGGTATVSGTGFTPNYYAYVYYQRPDGTYNAFYVTTDPTGTFSFTLGFLASHGLGTEYLSAYDYATGRWAPFVTVSVTSATPAPYSRSLFASPTTVRAGSSTTISGVGFSANQYVYVSWVRPDGTTGYTYAFTDANGTFAFTLGFLTQHGIGTETVQAYDYGTSLYSSSISVTVTS